MKIGVVGAGFVGSALINAVQSYCEVMICDKKRDDFFTVKQMCELKPDMIFVCVPTPSMDNGSVDASIVEEVVAQIPPDILVVVKSTVTPDHLTMMAIGRRLVYNPEFLTERNANDDFINPEMIVLGGGLHDCDVVHTFYQSYTKVRPCPFFVTSVASASLIKYALNCFLSAKIVFMNELYTLHQRVSPLTTWDQFTDILKTDTRVGRSFLQVPNPYGGFGFGGTCFPKDTKALLAYADRIGIDLSVLRQVVAKNKILRPGEE